ncbi:MAG: RdgB/HAM1 family non-canonical purine NTP pyrophosphatase [Candidatus Cloacimonetes bacterium]|nr:RdgB/HAM1 family non-canonical purine NTP pyrophosphatase [Candidatus Cloacimonadota bacterium]
MLKLLVASSNEGKVIEIQDFLSQFISVQCLSLKDLGFKGDMPQETGSTYQENAEIKAKYFADLYDYAVLADDSGLECEALSGRPGLFSARLGDNDKHRREELLKLLGYASGEFPYKSSFKSSLCFVLNGQSHFYDGEVQGWIKSHELGDFGFGYDPIFYLDDGRSFAQIDRAEKNKISHRASALLKFKDDLLQKSLAIEV